jgi:1-acyl-sn-glycerol-3-phosphate acyltransferase
MLRTAIVVLCVAAYIVIVGPPFILHSLVTGSVERLYRVGVAGAKVALRLASVRVRVECLENIPPGVCIFIANHSSNADPLAVVAAIPRRVALMAKKEVFRIPILSFALRLSKFVAVDRAHPEAAIASLRRATEYLKAGVSFVIFPEGTRSPDGRLRRFKSGTFVMAIEAGVPVVPISVVGAHKVMRKGERAIHPGEIVVRFHPAVETSTYTVERKEELIARVHAVVASGLPEEQRPSEPLSARGRGLGQGTGAKRSRPAAGGD